MLQIILPVGISFYTFQSLAYAIDVYRGRIAPVKEFPLFALYVAYFPQLVAGPIERAEHMIPVYSRPRVVYRGVFAGQMLCCLLVLGDRAVSPWTMLLFFSKAHELLRQIEPKNMTGVATRFKRVEAARARYNQMLAIAKEHTVMGPRQFSTHCVEFRIAHVERPHVP